MTKIPGTQDNPGSEAKTFDWDEYYKNKSNQTPRDTLIKALEFFKEEKESDRILSAIDVGCGHGADTIELLKNGWKVFATDGDLNGLRLLHESVNDSLKKNLRTERITFEDFQLKDPEKFDLLNASYCLPFCRPEYFDALWNKISELIVKGGMFSGQFFGKNDSWSDNKEMTFLKIEKVKELFKGFDIVYFEERDEDGATASGESKHWHVYSVIARKLA